MKHRSVGLYSGVLKDMILLFKYRGYKCLGHNLAQFTYRFLGKEESLWEGIDLILPVPLHRKKQGKRGFNQSLVLARFLGVQKNIPCDQKILKKVRQSPPQTSLEAEDRLRNLKDVFTVRRPDRISGKRVLLIDDVFTTGATLNECARMLLETGALEVRALTVAQAAPV
ncbi:ComF family protein [Acidobacteriota bacterium]